MPSLPSWNFGFTWSYKKNHNDQTQNWNREKKILIFIFLFFFSFISVFVKEVLRCEVISNLCRWMGDTTDQLFFSGGDDVSTQSTGQTEKRVCFIFCDNNLILLQPEQSCRTIHILMISPVILLSYFVFSR